MWLETPVFKEDMEQIVQSDFIHWERLKGRTVFITGATGLIGYYLANSIIYTLILACYIFPIPQIYSPLKICCHHSLWSRYH